MSTPDTDGGGEGVADLSLVKLISNGLGLFTLIS